LVKETETDVGYEWERLIVTITMLRNLFNDQSELNITKENMSQYLNYLNVKASATTLTL